MTGRAALLSCGFALLLAPLTGCGGSSSSGARTTVTSSPSPSAAPYSLARTRACLVARGGRVSGISSPNRRFQALRDAEQRGAVEITRGGRHVGLAIVPQAANATVVAELLQPSAPYVVETHENAVLLYAPGARTLAVAVLGCLR